MEAGPHISAALTIMLAGTPAILEAYSGVYFLTASSTLFPTCCVLRNKLTVDPTALDHDVQHPVEYADVAS